MTNLVQFPGLGIELNVPRVAISLFGLDIYWYGVIIVSGLVLAVIFATTQCKRFGVNADAMQSVVMVGLVCALIGGRLYYILPSDDMTIADFFNFRGGGIGIYGAIIGAFLGAAVACRIFKVPVLPLFDLAGMGFLIGQGIGRWGNFFNQEAFGTNTTLPWGMISPATTGFLQYRQAALAAEGISVDPNLPVHPTFLYESLWCGLGFLLLFLYRKKRRFNGEIFLFYIMWYGLGRFFIESLRTDALVSSILGMRISMVLAATSVAVSFCVWLALRLRHVGKPLMVPAVPDRVYTVTLPGSDAPVQVSWPANTKQPDKKELERLASEQLASGKEDDHVKEGQEPSTEPEAVDEFTAPETIQEGQEDTEKVGDNEKPQPLENTGLDEAEKTAEAIETE